MADIEVALTNTPEIAARDIARELYEKETKKSAISNKNSLNYQYVDEKILECKK